jgi:hypothetical protein
MMSRTAILRLPGIFSENNPRPEGSKIFQLRSSSGAIEKLIPKAITGRIKAKISWQWRSQQRSVISSS